MGSFLRISFLAKLRFPILVLAVLSGALLLTGFPAAAKTSEPPSFLDRPQNPSRGLGKAENLGGIGPLRVGPQEFRASGSDSCPKKIDFSNLPAGPPSTAEYLKLLDDLIRDYGTKAAKARPGLEAGFVKSDKPEELVGCGALLHAMGAGPASIFVTAQGVKRQPEDALAANNLGVELIETEDFPRAMAFLLYAEKLRPLASLTILNLGWLHYHIGDLDKAKEYFEKAEGLAPTFAGPKLGLGMIAKCRKELAPAAKYLRSSLRLRFSPVGARALQDSEQAILDSGQSLPDPKPVNQEPEEPCQLKIPDLPVFEKPAETAAAASKIDELAEKVGAVLESLTQDMARLGPAAASDSQPSVERTPSSISVRRTYDKERFMLEDIRNMLIGAQGFDGKYKGALNVWNTAAQAQAQKMLQRQMVNVNRLQALDKELLNCGDNDACQKQVLHKIDEENFRYCQEKKKDMEEFYSTYYKMYTESWRAFKAAAEDYLCFTDPILDRIDLPSLNTWENLVRRLSLFRIYQQCLGWAVRLEAVANGIVNLECTPPAPLEPLLGASELEVGNKPPNCPFKFSIKAWIFSMSVDCRTVKFEGGEFALGSIEYNYLKHETTLWGGMGIIDPVSPLSARLKLGAFVTFDRNGFQDVGMSSAATLKAGFGDAGVQAGFQARIGLESGLTF